MSRSVTGKITITVSVRPEPHTHEWKISNIERREHRHLLTRETWVDAYECWEQLEGRPGIQPGDPREVILTSTERFERLEAGKTYILLIHTLAGEHDGGFWVMGVIPIGTYRTHLEAYKNHMRAA